MREAVPLRLGQKVLMPSGRKAWVIEVRRHEIGFRYCDGGTVRLSRAVVRQRWGWP